MALFHLRHSYTLFTCPNSYRLWPNPASPPSLLFLKFGQVQTSRSRMEIVKFAFLWAIMLIKNAPNLPSGPYPGSMLLPSDHNHRKWPECWISCPSSVTTSHSDSITFLATYEPETESTCRNNCLRMPEQKKTYRHPPGMVSFIDYLQSRK